MDVDRQPPAPSRETAEARPDTVKRNLTFKERALHLGTAKLRCSLLVPLVPLPLG